jgi:hypothetical protein
MSKARERNEWARTARIGFLLYKFIAKGRRLKESDFNPYSEPKEQSGRVEEGTQISWEQFTKHYAKPRLRAAPKMSKEIKRGKPR